MRVTRVVRYRQRKHKKRLMVAKVASVISLTTFGATHVHSTYALSGDSIVINESIMKAAFIFPSTVQELADRSKLAAENIKEFRNQVQELVEGKEEFAPIQNPDHEIDIVVDEVRTKESVVEDVYESEFPVLTEVDRLSLEIEEVQRELDYERDLYQQIKQLANVADRDVDEAKELYLEIEGYYQRALREVDFAEGILETIQARDRVENTQLDRAEMDVASYKRVLAYVEKAYKEIQNSYNEASRHAKAIEKFLEKVESKIDQLLDRIRVLEDQMLEVELEARKRAEEEAKRLAEQQLQEEVGTPSEDIEIPEESQHDSKVTEEEGSQEELEENVGEESQEEPEGSVEEEGNEESEGSIEEESNEEPVGNVDEESSIEPEANEEIVIDDPIMNEEKEPSVVDDVYQTPLDSREKQEIRINIGTHQIGN